MPTRNDPVEVLGLERGASTEQVRKRYRELARRYHPDVNEGDSTAEWMFKQVNEAHEAIVAKRTEPTPRPRPRRPPGPREPPTAGSWTPPEPVDETGPWVVMTAAITAAAAGQIAGVVAERTGFADELAVLLGQMSGTSTSPAHATAATIFATAITLAGTVAARHSTWRDSGGGTWRPALQAVEALAYTTVAATLGSVAVIRVARYAAQ